MTGPFYNVVTEFGADPTGATDSTSAINAAVAAAKLAHPNGATIIYIPGNYSVDSIDSTCYNGVVHRGLGGPSAVTINGSRQMTPAAILDCTGSSAVIIDGIVFTGGSSTTNPPLAGLLLAATSAGSDSNANRVDNCGSTGYFGSAPLCVIASPCNQFYSNRFQQDHGGRPTLNISTTNDWYTTSKYQSISSGSATANVGNNTFFGNEFHGRKALSEGDADCWTIYGRSVDMLSFIGCLIDNSSHGRTAQAHILLQGTGNNVLTFTGSTFYTESGYQTVNLLRVDSGLGKFITHGCKEIGGYSGARLTGVTPGLISNL